MVIVDEQVMKAYNDKTEQITHKPVLFVLDEKGKRDYTCEKKALSSDGKPYVGPLEFVVQPNLREIAGDKAYEYLLGKRSYDLSDRAVDKEEGNGSNVFLTVGKLFMLAIAISGVVILAVLHFFSAGR
jgi:hypothetical protein